ncbi:terpenoid cyclases/protein prenyltransferase alpha-alpha toroid [Kockiozyma suomiensis]|uniref:terpenoid cyclases/protein prenyltransferase alpha-alpha toroid n=1 Tax=Kockiozyma suomiensis TaxID=1337062 RepID=UPI00334313D0
MIGPNFAYERHAGFFKYCLKILPQQYTPTDTTRLAIIFFCISALDLLGVIPNSEEENLNPNFGLKKVTKDQVEKWKDWIYETCLLPSRAAFRCSPALAFANDSSSKQTYDPGHTAGTYFALATLLILRDDLSRIDRPAMMRWLCACQRDDGSFATGLLETDSHHGEFGGEHFGEPDLRFGYCAAAIRWIIGGDLLSQRGLAPDIDVIKARAHVLDECVTYDGGMGMGGMTESHGGLTYCGVGMLDLLGGASDSLGDGIDELVRWCLLHQTAISDEDFSGDEQDEDDMVDGELLVGFNGRFNKPPDTCYSFWVGGTLAMLPLQNGVSSLALSDARRNVSFLLYKTQNTRVGGFSKCAGHHPDALHAYLGIAALSLCAETARKAGDDDEVWELLKGLKKLDAALCISYDARQYVEDLRRRW